MSDSAASSRQPVQSVPPQAFFLPIDSGRRGQRFCLFHEAVGTSTRGTVVYVHPFAEEMNKSRRMASIQARALSQAGYSVLQMDLLGCGDSSGDFSDATWQDWVADVVEASQWLQHREAAPLWLWGLRAGCLVATAAANELSVPCQLLFWQAPSAGNTLLQQFLRLKSVGDMLEGKAKGAMESIRQQLAAGSSVNVAGYTLAPGLAAGLDTATLGAPLRCGRVEWIELSTRADAVLLPVSERTLARWQEAGVSVRSHIVTGPAFWQTTEIEDVPGLIDATLAALAAPVETVAA